MFGTDTKQRVAGPLATTAADICCRLVDLDAVRSALIAR
jgi:hypothetical protein